MKQEWIERMHDQARMDMGVCVKASGDNWCDTHAALKFPGEEACRAMSVAYIIAESAGEVMEELARADEVQRMENRGLVSITGVLADLRAKVEGLEVVVADMWNGTGPHYYEHTVLLSDVLALLEEKP